MYCILPARSRLIVVKGCATHNTITVRMQVTVVTPLLAVTLLGLLLSTHAQEQQPGEMLCYACTFRTVGEATVGKFCGEMFDGDVSPNVTCTSACYKRETTGGVTQLQRGCFSDLHDREGATCEDFADRKIPNSDPPQIMTQLCCKDSLCNHADANIPSYVAVCTLIASALLTKWL